MDGTPARFAVSPTEAPISPVPTIPSRESATWRRLSGRRRRVRGGARPPRAGGGASRLRLRVQQLARAGGIMLADEDLDGPSDQRAPGRSPERRGRVIRLPP